MSKIRMASEAELQDAADALAVDMSETLSGILRTAANQLEATVTAAAEQPERRILDAAQASWLDAVNGNFFPRVVNAYVSAAESAHLQLIQTYGGPPADVPFLGNAAALSYLTDSANRMVDVTEGTWARARAQLIEGFSLGESTEQLAARIQSVTDWSAARAATIARTEIISASNAGALAQLRATGAVAKKTWLATKDNRTRETHRKADGQTVNVNNVFIVCGEALDFPGDPQGEPGCVINCRCTLVFDVKKSELSVALEDLPDVTDEFDPADFVDLNSLVAAGARDAFVRRPFDESKVRRNRGRFAPKSGSDAANTSGAGGERELTPDERYEVYAQFTAGNPLGFANGEILARQAAVVAHNNDMTPEEVMQIVDEIGPTDGGPWMPLSGKVDDYIAGGGSFPDHSAAGDARVPSVLPTRAARTSIDSSEEEAAANAQTGFPTGEFPRVTLAQADAMQNEMFDRSGFWNPTEREALRSYSSGGYLSVNNCLRFGENCSESTTARTNAIRESMRPLPRPLSAFRGVDLAALGVSDPAELEGLVGSTLNDPGFTSTSVSPAGTFDKDVKMQIDVPAGVLAAYVRSVSDTSRENELLLDAGSSFRITEYRPPAGPDEQSYLRLEMVP